MVTRGVKCAMVKVRGMIGWQIALFILPQMKEMILIFLIDLSQGGDQMNRILANAPFLVEGESSVYTDMHVSVLR